MKKFIFLTVIICITLGIQNIKAEPVPSDTFSDSCLNNGGTIEYGVVTEYRSSIFKLGSPSIPITEVSVKLLKTAPEEEEMFLYLPFYDIDKDYKRNIILAHDLKTAYLLGNKVSICVDFYYHVLGMKL